jgi:hypothetical protein
MTAQSTLPLLLALSAASCAPTTSKEPPRPERRFHFEYKTTLSGFPADAKLARVWIPLPADDEAQSVTNVKVDSPVPHRVTSESVYGDRAVYLEVVPPFPSELPVTLSMDVHRSEISSVKHVAGSPRRERLLEGDRLAPLNTEAHSRANQATQGLSDSNAQAHRIYERVLADVNYDKSGVGWGRGDLEYVCAAGKGNCSDFHSLFIAMARSKSIPAVFEIGFPILVDKKKEPSADITAGPGIRTLPARGGQSMHPKRTRTPRERITSSGRFAKTASPSLEAATSCSSRRRKAIPSTSSSIPTSRSTAKRRSPRP